MRPCVVQIFPFEIDFRTRVPEGFWDHVKVVMGEHFRENRFAEGLEEGIKLAGEKLVEYFPYLHDDANELSDEISFGK